MKGANQLSHIDRQLSQKPLRYTWNL